MKHSFLDKKNTVFFLLIFCVFLIFISFLQNKQKRNLDEAKKLPFYNTSLEKVHDGTFTGKITTSFMHVQLSVTVQNHTITDIKIIENKGSYGQKAKQIVQSMLKENKTVVPLIKGDEIGSLVFISCADNALQNGLEK
ncbi:MAG: hypothetical protein K6E97_06330 [Treponema sp.]|nr:hypothetical protein [Treponema sp.]